MKSTSHTYPISPGLRPAHTQLNPWRRRVAHVIARAIALPMIALLLAQSSAIAATWDAVTGFHSTQSVATDTWTYARRSGTGCATPAGYLTAYTLAPGIPGHHHMPGSLYQDLPIIAKNTNSTMSSVATVDWPAGALLIHPGAQTDCAVVQFKAAVAGTYQVTGDISPLDKVGPNRVVGHLFVGGIAILSPIVLQATGWAAPTVPFNATVTAAANQLIEFALDNGPTGSGSPFLYDSTRLNLKVTLQQSLPYSTVPVSVKNPACGPWKICFEVIVPKGGPVANGTAQVNLQIYQNGLPVGPLLTPVAGAPATTTTNPMTQDGIICFEVPVSASYLNPTLGGFDYVATTNYTMPGGPPPTPTVIGSQPQGVVQGLNNDVKYDPTLCTDSTASTCCPPLDKVSLPGLFDHFGNSNLGYQMGVNSAATVANRASFLAGYKAYLAYLKLICPTVAGLSVTFTLGTALGSGLLITPIPGATSTFVVTGPVTPPTVPPMFGNTLNNNSWYGIYANTVAVNGLGQTVNCGFDARSCDLNDRFTFNYQTGGKIAGGASPFTLGE